jgi:hypothetical protein
VDRKSGEQKTGPIAALDLFVFVLWTGLLVVLVYYGSRA